MKSTIAQIAQAIKGIKGCQFASLTYLSKTDGSLARYTVNLGFSYHNAVTKSVTELEILIAEKAAQWSELTKQAANEVMESLKKTLAAHAEGKQNDDYTKKDQYIPIGNGMNLNTTDNTIQLFGLLHSKVVLVEGTRKEVKSKPLTIEKNKIRRELSVSKFREFALDVENVAGVKVNGGTIELVLAESIAAAINAVAGVLVNTPSVQVNPTEPLKVNPDYVELTK